MSIESISAANNPATSSSEKKEDKSRTGLSNNLGDFLKLLTTQLKNQDPTSPLDTSQFTDQLIGFSGVEQQINTNGKLDKLVDSQTTTALNAQLTSSVNYIGKMVEVENNRFKMGATGDPKFSYEVPKGISNSTITIMTDTGQVIGTFKGKTEEGLQNLTWDGKDANGQRLPAGNYRFKVDMVNTEAKTIPAKTYTFGEVTSVEVKEGKTSVIVEGDYVVGIEKVRAVEAKPQTQQAA